METAKKFFPSSWRLTSMPVPEKRVAMALPGQANEGAWGSDLSKRPRKWMSSVGSTTPVPVLLPELVAALEVDELATLPPLPEPPAPSPPAPLEVDVVDVVSDEL